MKKYKIFVYHKTHLVPKWEPEVFHTGETEFISFKLAQEIKSRLNEMVSSAKYKVKQIYPHTHLTPAARRTTYSAKDYGKRKQTHKKRMEIYIRETKSKPVF